MTSGSERATTSGSERAETGQVVLDRLVPPDGVLHERGAASLFVRDDNFAFVPDASVDLVLTDPPFNIARKSNFHTWEHNTIHNYQVDGDKGWDTFTPEQFRDQLNAWCLEFARVLRKGGSVAVFCADAYVSHLMDAMTSAGLIPKRTFTWRKPNAVPVNRGSLPMSACEFIVWGVKPKAKWTFNADVPTAAAVVDPGSIEIEAAIVADKVATVVARAVRRAVMEDVGSGSHSSADVLEVVEQALRDASSHALDRVDNLYVEDTLRACVPNYAEHASATGKSRIHPTEKPVGLLRYLIALFSRPGDLVLDPFGGSGSTGVAAVELGRSVVLIEREEDFFAAASDRLHRVQAGRAGDALDGPQLSLLD